MKSEHVEALQSYASIFKVWSTLSSADRAKVLHPLNGERLLSLALANRRNAALLSLAFALLAKWQRFVVKSSKTGTRCTLDGNARMAGVVCSSTRLASRLLGSSSAASIRRPLFATLLLFLSDSLLFDNFDGRDRVFTLLKNCLRHRGAAAVQLNPRASLVYRAFATLLVVAQSQQELDDCLQCFVRLYRPQNGDEPERPFVLPVEHGLALMSAFDEVARDGDTWLPFGAEWLPCVADFALEASLRPPRPDDDDSGESFAYAAMFIGAALLPHLTDDRLRCAALLDAIGGLESRWPEAALVCRARAPRWRDHQEAERVGMALLDLLYSSWLLVPDADLLDRLDRCAPVDDGDDDDAAAAAAGEFKSVVDAMVAGRERTRYLLRVSNVLAAIGRAADAGVADALRREFLARANDMHGRLYWSLRDREALYALFDVRPPADWRTPLTARQHAAKTLALSMQSSFYATLVLAERLVTPPLRVGDAVLLVDTLSLCADYAPTSVREFGVCIDRALAALVDGAPESLDALLGSIERCVAAPDCESRRCALFLSALAPLVDLVPPPMAESRLLPALYDRLLTSTQRRANAAAHGVFARLFATQPSDPADAAWQRSLAPSYVSVSLEHYPVCTSIVSMARTFDAIVERASSRDALVVLLLRRLVARFDALNPRATDDDHDGDGAGKVHAHLLAVVLFRLIFQVDVALLDSTLHCAERLLSSVDDPLPMMQTIYRLMSTNYDSTRKDRCMEWYYGQLQSIQPSQ
jgi:hypothetical protein